MKTLVKTAQKRTVNTPVQTTVILLHHTDYGRALGHLGDAWSNGSLRRYELALAWAWLTGIVYYTTHNTRTPGR